MNLVFLEKVLVLSRYILKKFENVFSLSLFFHTHTFGCFLLWRGFRYHYITLIGLKRFALVFFFQLNLSSLFHVCVCVCELGLQYCDRVSAINDALTKFFF